jgi:hypothetical protein
MLSLANNGRDEQRPCQRKERRFIFALLRNGLGTKVPEEIAEQFSHEDQPADRAL